jgi:hypothetical protein
VAVRARVRTCASDRIRELHAGTASVATLSSHAIAPLSFGPRHCEPAQQLTTTEFAKLTRRSARHCEGPAPMVRMTHPCHVRHLAPRSLALLSLHHADKGAASLFRERIKYNRACRASDSEAPPATERPTWVSRASVRHCSNVALPAASSRRGLVQAVSW